MTSRWFHVQEFCSHDGIAYPDAWMDRLNALCTQLDAIRSMWGGPLRVVSGYRTPAHNAKVGGASASQHMEGRAADIAPMVPNAAMLVSVNDLYARVMRAIGVGDLPLIGGIGYYSSRWIHIDVRPKPSDGHIARWNGTGIGSEIA